MKGRVLMMRRMAVLLAVVLGASTVLLATPAGAQYVEILGCSFDRTSGDEVVNASGDGFVPGTEVAITLDDTAVPISTAAVVADLGTTNADADGAVAVSVTIPDDLEGGNYFLTLTGAASTGGTRALQCPFTVDEVLPRVQERVAFTGSNSRTMASVALGLIGVGAFAVFAAKRRGRDSVDASV